MVLGGSVGAAGRGSPQAGVSMRAVRGISMAANAETVTVSIDVSGPRATPASGFVDGPPRIYLDFPGVALQVAGVTASHDSRVKRIRAGVHSARPLVTRIVIDLESPLQYRIATMDGRVTVTLGLPGSENPGAGVTSVQPRSEPVVPAPPPPPVRNTAPPTAAPVTRPASPPIPLVPDLPPSAPRAAMPPAPQPAPTPPVDAAAAAKRPPATPAARPATSASRAPASAKDSERYLRQVSPALDRLRLQEPLLTSLDGAEEQTPDRVQLALEEFERLRQDLSGMKPPDSLRSQHDMLLQSTILALMATRLRLEAFVTSDAATLRNAASAAAGATLLLDRACADLGCPDSNR
jgi:hypothetical protein